MTTTAAPCQCIKCLSPCQCIKCLSYLVENRCTLPEYATPENQHCDVCYPNGIPRTVKATLTDPLSLEVLGSISEECAEVIQRKEKIVRWGWQADFDGTTQKHKLESELGDLLAAIAIAAYNNQISVDGVVRAYKDKLRKLQEDAEGPRQRLMHAEIPDNSILLCDLVSELLYQAANSGERLFIEHLLTQVMGK